MTQPKSVTSHRMTYNKPTRTPLNLQKRRANKHLEAYLINSGKGVGGTSIKPRQQSVTRLAISKSTEFGICTDSYEDQILGTGVRIPLLPAPLSMVANPRAEGYSTIGREYL